MREVVGAACDFQLAINWSWEGKNVSQASNSGTSPTTTMALEPVHCPTCDSTNIVKHGKTVEGNQRYKCRNSECPRHSFVLEYSYRGYLPHVKQPICEMALNGSSICDTARVLQMSLTTVIEELKKRSSA